MNDANEVAILIDGYCMLINRNVHSLWRSSVDNVNLLRSNGPSPPRFLAPHPLDVAFLKSNLTTDNNRH
jgi:hypothetical protein